VAGVLYVILKMTLRLLIALVLSISLSHAKRPQIASYMKSDKEITKIAHSTLKQVSKGEVSIKYVSSLVYGDGGSSGTVFSLSNSKFLTVFVPFWSARYPKDVRLSVSDTDSTDGWSDTLQENPSLEVLLEKMVKKVSVTAKDKQTIITLRELSESINRKPDETIEYDKAKVSDNKLNPFTDFPE
jgi:hypothetical protein